MAGIQGYPFLSFNDRNCNYHGKRIILRGMPGCDMDGSAYSLHFRPVGEQSFHSKFIQASGAER